MPTRKEILMVVKEWVEKAEDDYRAAAHLLSMADGPIPYTIICFHAQQCVEKYLKAILVDHSLHVPKTHDIEEIVRLLPASLSFNPTAAQMRHLTSFAVDFRYPGGDVTGKVDAEEIMAITGALRASARATLPAEVIGEQKMDASTEGSDTTMAG
uniref:HEPN domain-containing protein n=1 Tax=Candidatus Kentrum eta TaxID=2126337 RepID=A0A450V305_9GAMM|nr:MAG: HEPN domain-containing protein [Candidatus Kentron sp. H]VFJ93958.1 MAG: HEPN domain-containing protein [Candidatus Kentron sp. H]VFJ99171.1 MAG: HEPN domain-containing protein [Candidatus Kentron sp. H]